jgi:chromatin remodeling complex protein RSC6
MTFGTIATIIYLKIFRLLDIRISMSESTIPQTSEVSQERHVMYKNDEEKKNIETSTVSDDTFDSVLQELDSMKNQLRLVYNKVKYLKKNYHKRKNTNIKSGFVKPVNVSTELATFLHMNPEDKVPRSVVNKKINEYIKTNDLQVPEFRQTFMLDDQLATVFRLNTGTVVNYFKMQSYLKHHYPKSVA